MPDTLFSLIAFVLITTFSPGPNNISSAAMGVLHGYQKTLPYLVGMNSGLFGVMLVSAWASATLLGFFPMLEPVLRYVGAAYILYLALGMFKASYSFAPSPGIEDGGAAVGKIAPLGFANGLLLQVFNPKLMVYSLTLFTTFLAPITQRLGLLLLAVVLLTITSFTATSSWALFGMVIKRYLHHPKARFAINLILALFLVYTALTLAGVI